VTELGFWLQRRPAHAALGYLTVPDGALEPAVDALRPLRLRGVVGALPLFLVPGPPGAPPLWFGPVGLQGSLGAVAAYREELTTALPAAARVVFPSPDAADDPTARATVLAALSLPPTPFVDAALRLAAAPLAPPPFAPEFMLAYLGGPSVQHPTGPPASADPLDQGYGLYFVWLTCPALGREVRRMLDVVRRRLAADGFPPLISLRLANGRAAVLVLRVVFDRKLEERRSAARACHRAILEAAIAAGYPPARVGIEGMDALDPAGSTYWAVVDRLKRALDPAGIVAPGRYAPSPARRS
jgi:4-cresol dehydrogenase (hydroxylating) flavoprotein subunit